MEREWTDEEAKRIVHAQRLIQSDKDIRFAVLLDQGEVADDVLSPVIIERIKRFGRSGWDNGAKMADQMDRNQEYSEDCVTHLKRLMDMFRERRKMSES